MGSLVVPVIDVQNENFTELWPAMVLAIKTASFVALDTELSGLGNRKSLLAESIEDRYRAILHAARSRSILSLGIACYKRLDDKAADTYLVQVYNLTLLCSEEYVIEPQSVKFLVQHGFDFNKQYASGVPYLKGNNKGASDDRAVGIRGLFTELLRARKPMVFHNGLIDMAFLYQSFYSQLPDRLDNFTADLSEMFPAGVFDTKYVTEFELRLTASYLEYAYKKCKLDNSRLVTSGGTGPHVHVEFCQYAGHMSSYVDYRVCPAVTAAEGPTDICQRFSAFGWCPNGAECPSSHDTDLIILQDEKGAGDKKKKRRKIREKKRARGEAGNGPSIFDGAPEHKIPHMEADPGDTAAELRPKREPPMDGGGNPPPQSEGMDVKAGGEGKGASGDDPDRRNPVTAETAAAAAAAMAAAKAAAASATSAAASAARAASAATAAVTAATSAAASATSATAASAATAAATAAPTDDTNESREEDGGRGALSDHPSEAGAPKTKVDTGTHRAGFDAFMTGYIFAHACTLIKEDGVGAVEKEQQQQQQQEEKKKENKEEKAKSWLPTCFNKVYLSGKATPLNVVKSTFAKSSRAHLQKMEMLWGGAV